MSAGVKDADLAHKWIDGLPGRRRRDCSSPTKAGYGNTTNVEVNKAAGFTYGDKLSWLQQAKTTKRAAVWNEV